VSNEVFRMGGVEHGLAPGQHDRGVAEVDHRRHQQAAPRVAMVVVAPREADVAEGSCVFDGPEAFGGIPDGNLASETGFPITGCRRTRTGDCGSW
jgi:hypothetical protein